MLACQFWDPAEVAWSSDGCSLSLQEGDAICSCTHLTDFIVFEFPTSTDALLATLASSVAVNEISARAWECLADPGRSWHSINEAWWLSILMIVSLVVLMAAATMPAKRSPRSPDGISSST